MTLPQLKLRDIKLVLQGASKIAEAVIQKNANSSVIIIKALIQHSQDAVQTYIDSTKHSSSSQSHTTSRTSSGHSEQVEIKRDPFGFPEKSNLNYDINKDINKNLNMNTDQIPNSVYGELMLSDKLAKEVKQLKA